ncbi:3-beta hydroxysteroid dehydrogenase [Niabella ginsenosidivorans]|uniref:3-beta hydroxysteroid dehydrogenase n=1 Tax=Niabella ginsenosidivorans TaxID=1176587 RepID=A0A1A9I3A2_9BACT|nr:SDR family oxidoreductase [Niabella ginsenosidivorans]ANH81805.1 3-beta hydroxysteroid dehydrogenase [Niabella ginsenosidivorans]
MKIFVTGASGFVGSAVVRELISAGHQVIGLARSEKSANIVSEAGAEILLGKLEDLDLLKQGALNADGIIHMAFFHDFMLTNDFSQFMKAAEMDKNAINAMGETLIGTGKPIIVTSGMLGLPLINGFATEESTTQHSPRTSEATALALAEKGVNASVIRLAPSVHDKGDHGFIPFIISLARKNGVSAYPSEGTNRWCAVHRLDAARAFRSAIEKGIKGALYNVVGDTGIKLKTIATLIGETLNLPVTSLSGEALTKHFEWMSNFITMDSPATSFKTQEQLGWKPEHIGLLEDMQQNYF